VAWVLLIPREAALATPVRAHFLGGIVRVARIGGPPGTNQLLPNPFMSYHFGDGWSLGSSPNITANWLTSGGKWTVPAGGGFGKVVRLGTQPIKLELDAYYNAIRPKASNETWLLQATLTLPFPR
jgi:hypothetical protein